MDELEGGISAGAGRYVYQKVIRSPITNLVGKHLGKYADVGSAFLWGMGLKYLAKSQSGKTGMAANVAAYVPVGDAIGVLLGDAPMPTSTGMPTGGSGTHWGGLTSVPLNRGFGGTTSVR